MNYSLSALSARIYPIVDFEVVGTRKFLLTERVNVMSAKYAHHMAQLQKQ